MEETMSEESNRKRLEKKNKDKKPNELVVAVQEGVDALKEGKKLKTTAVAITDPTKVAAGQLRQRVKSGELDPAAVLTWLYTQEYKSDELVTWLNHKVTGIVPPPKQQEKKGSSRKKKEFEEEKKGIA